MEPTKPASNQSDPKAYLDYIDKEMNFCGIITTFSLACVLFMFDKLLSKPEATTNINFKSIYFITALISLTVSAFLLFRQRSNLAHHFGQISLEATQKGFTGKPMTVWLQEVDAWSFWSLYIYAITLIKCAFIEIFSLLIITFYGTYTIPSQLDKHSLIISLLIVIFGIVITYFQTKKLSSMQTTDATSSPDYKVYTRIGVSKIPEAGIGIIAIIDIPKDEYIFFPDDDTITWIEEEKITHLPASIQKLYLDFCIKENGRYGCPTSFNKLTPAWYLNHSKGPNVYADNEYRFKALRDIKAGEELTADYSSYSKEPITF